MAALLVATWVGVPKLPLVGAQGARLVLKLVSGVASFNIVQQAQQRVGLHTSPAINDWCVWFLQLQTVHVRPGWHGPGN